MGKITAITSGQYQWGYSKFLKKNPPLKGGNYDWQGYKKKDRLTYWGPHSGAYSTHPPSRLQRVLYRNGKAVDPPPRYPVLGASIFKEVIFVVVYYHPYTQVEALLDGEWVLYSVLSPKLQIAEGSVFMIPATMVQFNKQGDRFVVNRTREGFYGRELVYIIEEGSITQIVTPIATYFRVDINTVLDYDPVALSLPQTSQGSQTPVYVSESQWPATLPSPQPDPLPTLLHELDYTSTFWYHLYHEPELVENSNHANHYLLNEVYSVVNNYPFPTSEPPYSGFQRSGGAVAWTEYNRWRYAGYQGDTLIVPSIEGSHTFKAYKKYYAKSIAFWMRRTQLDYVAGQPIAETSASAGNTRIINTLEPQAEEFSTNIHYGLISLEIERRSNTASGYFHDSEVDPVVSGAIVVQQEYTLSSHKVVPLDIDMRIPLVQYRKDKTDRDFDNSNVDIYTFVYVVQLDGNEVYRYEVISEVSGIAPASGYVDHVVDCDGNVLIMNRPVLGSSEFFLAVFVKTETGYIKKSVEEAILKTGLSFNGLKELAVI